MAVVAGRGVATGRAQADVTSGRNNADVSQREDLANFISMITRDETPFMSSIGKTKATAMYHEWQTDSLQAPGDSRVSEGTDYIIPGRSGQSATNPERDALGNVAGQSVGSDFANIGPDRSRLGNYTQINGKTIAVSGTRRVVDQAGVADEYAYQLKKRGTELRRDLERDLIHSANVSTSSGRRSFGGINSWINHSVANTGLGATTAGTVISNGAMLADSDGGALVAPSASTTVRGTHAMVPTGTKTSLSLSDIDLVMQRIYEEGGKASKIMLSPKLRRDFSDLMVTDSGVRRNIDMDGKLRQSVDIYMSDFGDLMVVPNYIMGLSNTPAASNGTPITSVGNLQNSTALIYDPMWFSIATLRPLQEVDVGQRGDSTVGMMVEECTLEVKNPFGCGAIYNLQ